MLAEQGKLAELVEQHLVLQKHHGITAGKSSRFEKAIKTATAVYIGVILIFFIHLLYLVLSAQAGYFLVLLLRLTLQL